MVGHSVVCYYDTKSSLARAYKKKVGIVQQVLI